MLLSQVHSFSEAIIDKKSHATDYILDKGQLISKCPYEKSVLSKIPTKKFPGFLP